MGDQRTSGIRRKEQQVSALQPLSDSIADPGLADRAARQIDPISLEDVLCETGTIK
jgi:hypothetical protein